MKQEIEQAVDQMTEEDEPSPDHLDTGPPPNPKWLELTDEEKRFWFDWDEGGLALGADNADTGKFNDRELAAKVDAVKAVTPWLWAWYKEADRDAPLDEPYPPRDEE